MVQFALVPTERIPMQKKHLNKARRARTGMTSKAEKTGKAGTQGTAGRPDNTGIAGRADSLTPEQRRAKRLRDRKYRARKRAAACAALAQGRTVSVAEVETSAAPDLPAAAGHPHATRRRQCRKCGRCGKGFGADKVPADRMDPNSPCAGVQRGSAVAPPRAADVHDVQDVFSLIGRIVVGELAKAVVPPASQNCTRPVQVERGVPRQEMSLPGGSRAVVTLVDGDEVDPLSPNSPVPWPIRRHLLLRRMAREISGIVDSHLECS